MAGNKRKIQEINAGSMADISFLLLIFFIVATTMNVDSGIQRMLPPMPPEDMQVDNQKVKERNMLPVTVSRTDQLFVDNQAADISQLRDLVRNFFLNPTNDPNLPEKETRNIPLIGDYPVSLGVISLSNTRQTSYDMYIKVQNELTRAVNEMRDELSMQKFGKKFLDLDADQIEAVSKAIPNSISEAETQDVG